MAEYLMKWNSGYGDMYEAVEASTIEAARDSARDICREEAESNLDWDAELMTDELREDYL